MYEEEACLTKEQGGDLEFCAGLKTIILKAKNLPFIFIYDESDLVI